MEFLLELDLFAFDRLHELTVESHNAHLLQLTNAMMVATNVGFSGQTEPLDELSKVLSPRADREASERRKVAQGFEQAKRLFGG